MICRFKPLHTLFLFFIFVFHEQIAPFHYCFMHMTFLRSGICHRHYICYDHMKTDITYDILVNSSLYISIILRYDINENATI